MTGLILRLLDNCCGCGFEVAAVGIGPDANNPDETYGRKCWANPEGWDSPRPAHTHLDGRGHGPECNQ